ncbi:MAG TPA: hypothetical protein VNM69_23130 [Bacillus sp. (in: firmicutes)]|nr:hypothetical protein [Bacillus sp. (in: firmicutes)]
MKEISLGKGVSTCSKCSNKTKFDFRKLKKELRCKKCGEILIVVGYSK